jgi:Fe-S oxidoreductase
MAARTVGRFNEAAEKEGRGKVVTWCPSCHMHMSDIMSPGNAAAFEVAHITELLAERADRLAPLLQVAVNRRVLLHRHLGFATHVAVNDRVAGLLSRIPGLQLVQGPAHPGHMCSAAFHRARRARQGCARDLGGRRARTNCDTVCTIFHSCHARVGGSGRQRKRPRQDLGSTSSPRPWGLEASDALSRLAQRQRSGTSALIGKGRRVAVYRQLVETEIRKPPPL